MKIPPSTVLDSAFSNGTVTVWSGLLEHVMGPTTAKLIMLFLTANALRKGWLGDFIDFLANKLAHLLHDLFTNTKKKQFVNISCHDGTLFELWNNVYQLGRNVTRVHITTFL